MNKPGVKILRYTGYVLIILSIIEMVLEILNAIHFDLLGISSEGAANLFYLSAGNAAVELLFSMVGLIAGYVAVALGGNEQYNKYLRYFGIVLIVVYVVEGAMIFSQSNVYSWVRVLVLLVVSCIYLYGAIRLDQDTK